MNATPMVGISLIGLMLLALLLGGLVLLVVLIANKPTRKVGLVLLAVPVLLIPVLMVGRAVLSNQRIQHVQFDTVMPEPGAVLPIGSPLHVTTTPAWSRITVLLAGLGGLYLLLKLVNSQSGWGAGAVLGLTALGLLLVVAWMRMGVAHPRMILRDQEQASQMAVEDWEALTRPRILLTDRKQELSEQVDDEDRVHYTVVANGRELIFNENTPMAEAIAEIKKIWLADGKHLTLESGGGGHGSAGGFRADTVGDLLHKSLALARQQAEKQKDTAPSVEKLAQEAYVVDPPSQERPKWIDQPPKRIGKVYRQVIATGPYATADECYEELNHKLLDAAADYLRRQHSGAGQYAQQLPSLGITPAMLLQEVCVDEYLETFESKSLGNDMKRLYVQVEFDEPFRQRLDRAYRSLDRRGAVEGVTLVGVLGLLLVGGVFGLLKIDEATKGYYTKRLLFLGVPVVIIGLWQLFLALDHFEFVDL